jgi:hypothetical protein
MILSIKNDLLESDFSMCLAHLLNYPEPKVPEVLLKYALKIKEKLKEPPSIYSNMPDIAEYQR